MQRIPVGITSFTQAKNKDLLFIDKSKELLYLVQHYKFAFLSRPRQFGKSLLLGAIKTLFSKGIEPYFKGTYIAGCNDDGSPRWDEPLYPVVSLDFSGCVNESLDTFRQLFVAKINLIASKLDLEPIHLKRNIAQSFIEFSKELVKKYPQGYVLLIDEYNTPLNHSIGDSIAFEKIRNELHYLYANIKQSKISAHLRFMLVTGITHYEELSVPYFNLKDITYDSNLATILGFTKDEILYYFKDYLKIAIEKLHHCKSEDLDNTTYQAYLDDLLKTLETYYGNYSFDEFGKKTVFSPWSVNNFFKAADLQEKVCFNDYWFDAGGLPPELEYYLKHHFKDFLKIYQNQCHLSKFTIKNPCSIHEIDFRYILLQTGYLSLAKGSSLIDGGVLVTLPNLELRQALTSLCLYENFGDYSLKFRIDLKKFLEQASAQEIFDKFNEILATTKEHQISLENEEQVKTLFEMFALSAGVNCYVNSPFDANDCDTVDTKIEDNHGSILTLEYNGRTIVFRFSAVNCVDDSLQIPSDPVDKKFTSNPGKEHHKDVLFNPDGHVNKQKLFLTVVYDDTSKMLVSYKAIDTEASMLH